MSARRAGGRIGPLLMAAAVAAAIVVPDAAAQSTGRVPSRVVLEGTLELDRSNPPGCTIAVPTLHVAELSLEVDFAAGTVAGEIRNGVGTGSMSSKGPPCYAGHHYSAEVRFHGTVSGTADAATGSFAADLVIYVDSATGQDLATVSPDVYETTERTQGPLLTGTFRGEPGQVGQQTGEIDWWAWFCIEYLEPAPGSIMVPTNQSRAICPTLGTWRAEVVDIAWPNSDPTLSLELGVPQLEVPLDPSNPEDAVVLELLTTPLEDVEWPRRPADSSLQAMTELISSGVLSHLRRVASDPRFNPRIADLDAQVLLTDDERSRLRSDELAARSTAIQAMALASWLAVLKAPGDGGEFLFPSLRTVGVQQIMRHLVWADIQDKNVGYDPGLTLHRLVVLLIRNDVAAWPQD